MVTDARRCPPPEELERLLAEGFNAADLTAVEAHVETCASCQARLERLVTPPEPLLRSSVVAPLGDSPAHEPDQAFLDRLRRLTLPERLLGEVAEPISPGVGADDRAPSHLGPYDILGRLGRGGMGTVYKARHRELDKIVAVKVLSTQAANGPAVARFRTEMKAVGRLDHPNIVAAHDAGRVDGLHFLVMDFVDGLDLSRLVERQGPLPIADACELARQAAVGLRHAHERGLVHRDVKPSNLMLARGGLVKVLDLGLARVPGGQPPADGLTASGFVLGTADYVAPEQIGRAQTADARADIYGLGATLYFLLTGAPPFGGDGHPSWLDKLRAHQEEPVPPVRGRRAEVPAALGSLVEQMLAKNPADRPATAAGVADALRPFAAVSDLSVLLTRARDETADTAGTPATDVPPWYTHPEPPRGGRGTKRRRFPAAVALALLVGAVFLAVFLWREFGRTPVVDRPAEPVRILGAEVRHVRGKDANPVGLIGVDRKPILVNDAVRFSVKLSAPAYCYLVAFNPDGREQLCHPEAATEELARAAVPAKLAELSFPRDGGSYFVLDAPGLQAFVLVASSQPLPPFAAWRARVGAAPWPKSDRLDGGVWRFDGTDWAELVEKWELTPVSKAAAKLKLPDWGKKPSGSGQTEVRGRAPPKPLADLADFFRRPEFEAVQVVSFPVFRAPD